MLNVGEKFTAVRDSAPLRRAYGAALRALVRELMPGAVPAARAELANAAAQVADEEPSAAEISGALFTLRRAFAAQQWSAR